MKKKNIYPLPDQPDAQILHEPEAAYLKAESLGETETYPVMSMKEALTSGMLLEESRRLIFERIRQDFR